MQKLGPTSDRFFEALTHPMNGANTPAATLSSPVKVAGFESESDPQAMVKISNIPTINISARFLVIMSKPLLAFFVQDKENSLL